VEEQVPAVSLVQIPRPRVTVPRVRIPPVSLTAAARRVRGLLRREPAEPPPVAVPERFRGTGPVVLVGGFCTSALAMDPLRTYLTALGYTVTTCSVDAGMGCGGRSVERLGAVVREAAAQDPEGRGVRLLGYSRGGQFARAVARDPELPIRSLVTLGTPFDMFGVSRPLLLQIAAVALAGTLGVRRLFTLACLTGPCCASFRDTLRAPVPVPFSAICSRTDGLVRWSACQDPQAHLVEVPGHHLALLHEPAPLLAVAEQLHRCDELALAATG
jgi:pimeloyl-ACP methyl ester carboxylesterase